MTEHEDWLLTSFFQFLEQHQGLFIVAEATFCRFRSADNRGSTVYSLTCVAKAYEQRVHFPVVVDLVLL